MWFHDLPPGPWRSVSATLEIVTEPRADSLYFWALQATFTDGTGAPHGVAHTGLQWNPRHPGNRAVNWGGYRQAADVTSILDGTHSALPGIPGDENTRNFAWRAGVGYRFTIARGDQGWRSTVTDLETGAQTVIRELLAAGDRLAGFVVWMEVFAPCDAPTTTVRWSDLEMADDDRQARHSVRSVATSFPDAAGGCTNNDSRVDGNGGWLQLTNDERTAATATVLSVD
ncbi:MAG: hypothetical protein JWM34_3610 [Ilumatobacteraceae bacterium]|nr:hypothetical protein [Ilumatobacteraceae bacterium]